MFLTTTSVTATTTAATAIALSHRVRIGGSFRGSRSREAIQCATISQYPIDILGIREGALQRAHLAKRMFAKGTATVMVYTSPRNQHQPPTPMRSSGRFYPRW